MSTSLHTNEPECLVASADQVAKMLRISLRHLWTCHSSGKLGPRPISLGRSKRWRIEELRAWLVAGAPDRDTWDTLLKTDPRIGTGASNA